MTQTAGAFMRVEGALTFFINYYTSLANFKAVVDRLSSFDLAIDRAKALAAGGPARVADRTGFAPVALEHVVVTLPDGQPIVQAEALALANGESVLLAGPSGSGKSTLFRAIRESGPLARVMFAYQRRPRSWLCRKSRTCRSARSGRP